MGVARSAAGLTHLMQGAEEECGMRDFDPMQNAEEECGMQGKQRDEFGCGMRSRAEWGVAVDPSAPIQTQISTLVPLPVFLFCMLHWVELPHPVFPCRTLHRFKSRRSHLDLRL